LRVIPDCWFGCVFPFLLAFQQTLAHRECPCLLALHTFILCGVFDVTSASQTKLQEIANSVVNERLTTIPSQIEFRLAFVSIYLESLKEGEEEKRPIGGRGGLPDQEESSN
jgi:hypothetical protein